MYDETVKRLKNCATQAAPCLTCDMTDDGSCIETLMKQAADAIEELTGFVQEAERDRDEYRERLDKANDAIEELQKRVPKSGVWREEESGYDEVYYECSVCGAGICTVDGDPVDNAWSYCPECGAKMTGVERLPEPPEEERA